MTRQEAVVLSYLEWVRLIGTGAIRIDEKRIFRWRLDRTDPVMVVGNLMLGAPDLGTSATSFVLAVLEPEVLDPIRGGGLYLGQRLHLEAVRSFHSFGETALAIHRHDAEAAGVAIGPTPLAVGWASWVEAVEAADRRARGEALLAILEVSPSDRFAKAADWLANREQSIAPDDIARSRDTMFYGWACVLNAEKVSTGEKPILPADVKEEADTLRLDFNVDQPFLARAPLLCAFVGGLAADGERAADLLAMASLKQHERYVIKREGAALDLPSLFDDIRVLEDIDEGAAGLLVQALGERLPSELIRALKVQGVTRAIAPVGMLAPAGEQASTVPDRIYRAEVDPTLDLLEPQRLPGPLNAPDLLIGPDTSTEGPSGSAFVTETDATAETPAIVVVEVGSELLQTVHANDDLTDQLRGSSALDQPGLDLGLEPNKVNVASSTAAVPLSPAVGQQAGVTSNLPPRSQESTSRKRTSKNTKHQSASPRKPQN